jgi:hypothetical protein
VSYGIRLEIGLTPVPGVWDGLGRIAVADVSVAWGRESVYDDAEPSDLAFSIIDVDGTWASGASLAGTPVVLYRTNPEHVIYRGRVSEVDVSRVTIQNPRTEEPQAVWLAKFTTTDVLSDLMAAKIAGPGDDYEGIEEYGPHYWPVSPAITRINDIYQAVKSPNVVGIDFVSELVNTPSVAAHSHADGLSALDLIALVYRLMPLSHPNYNPRAQRVSIGRTAENSGLSLVWNGDRTEIQLKPVKGYTLDAARVEVPKDANVTSTNNAAIDKVEVTSSRWDSTDLEARKVVEVVTEAHTARSDRIQFGQRVLKIETDLWGNEDVAAELATTTASLVNQLNGKFTLPALTFDFRRFASNNDDLDRVLLDTMTHSTGIYFRRSMFSGLDNVGPLFQIIGGTIRWEPNAAGVSGWVTEFTVAPASGTPTPITWDQIAPEVTYDDLDDSITFRDLTYLTDGDPN